jgi:osmotically inducible lipoprotein OsmB
MNKQRILLTTFTILSLSSLALTGCRTPSDTGLVTGGVIGGVAGSALTRGSTVGTVAGAVGGAMIGRDTARRNYGY